MSGRKSLDHETSVAIGKRIRAIRGSRTQQEFADLIGVDRATLANYEIGRRTPTAETMNTISDVSGVPLAELFFGEVRTANRSFREVETILAEEMEKRPGFLPRCAVSDDEIALLKMLRTFNGTALGRSFIDLIREMLGQYRRLDADENAPVIEPEDLDRLLDVAGRGRFAPGFDPVIQLIRHIAPPELPNAPIRAFERIG